MDHAALICEIFDGYSEIPFGGEKLFLRHVTLGDQRVLTAEFERQKIRAIENFVPTEKERLDQLEKENHWTEQDELEIRAKQEYLANLKQTKSQLELKSAKKNIQETIDAETKELNKILYRRRDLVGKTAEDFANSRSNEEFIRNILYKDSALKIPAFSAEEFGALEIADLAELMAGYYALSGKVNDETIQELLLSDSFSLYLGQVEKAFDFFGKPIVNLSIFQLKLLAYGKMFLNIFQNVDNIPDNVKKSPKDLLDFVDTQKKREKNQQKGGKQHQAMGMVGATKEDLESYDPTAKKLDFGAELKKKGGKMSTEDIAKMMNQ